MNKMRQQGHPNPGGPRDARSPRATRVLVTGAAGFVGTALCSRLVREGYQVRAVLREGGRTLLPAGVEGVALPALGGATDWGEALEGVDLVVHLAARVHQLRETAPDPLAAYRAVNVQGAVRLAREAARAGVRRLVFASSVKVHGEGGGDPYRELTPPAPLDPYGISKWEAEQALWRVAEETGLEVVVLRPPLVYGPGGRANFFKLFRVIERGLPLPLGSLKNRRSLIYLENLVDALLTALRHPAAAGETFLVSDGEDLSTTQLVRRAAQALKVPARLVPFPAALLRLAGVLSGRNATVQRLTGSLAVDSSRIRERLGWRPPYSVGQGLEETARWYLAARKEEP
ncbi:UDP-glucose 4-epimerase [Geomonas silvestris]|uniref:UDP-glucose 4-epimerase n=1 Tax=Geomonas silvestris TaxID=2740184 RepID=A0A6V8MH63_9BACT|nr:SDR family oxidoreductase [Geomonas silvestris]GFO59331.1 UDP-glucose 4-epimerase [Geomonas silvestris]